MSDEQRPAAGKVRHDAAEWQTKARPFRTGVIVVLDQCAEEGKPCPWRLAGVRAGSA